MAGKPQPRASVVQPLDQSYRLIPLTQGQSAKVSSHRFEELNRYSWYAAWSPDMQGFYAVREVRENGIRYTEKMHRIVVGVPRGDMRPIDHINHDTLDNTDENLRVCTTSENKMNSRRYRTNKEQFKGVHFHKRLGKVAASIRIEGKLFHLGTFPATDEGRLAAALAYDSAATQHFGEFASLNFPR